MNCYGGKSDVERYKPVITFYMRIELNVCYNFFTLFSLKAAVNKVSTNEQNPSMDIYIT